MPETRQWNLTFERQVFKQQRLRFSYNGNQGRNLVFYGRDNLPLSPLYGAIFASLLFVLFAAGILKGTIFPEIHTPGSKDTVQTGTAPSPGAAPRWSNV